MFVFPGAAPRRAAAAAAAAPSSIKIEGEAKAQDVDVDDGVFGLVRHGRRASGHHGNGLLALRAGHEEAAEEARVHDAKAHGLQRTVRRLPGPPASI